MNKTICITWNILNIWEISTDFLQFGFHLMCFVLCEEWEDWHKFFLLTTLFFLKKTHENRNISIWQTFETKTVNEYRTFLEFHFMLWKKVSNIYAKGVIDRQSNRQSARNGRRKKWKRTLNFFIPSICMWFLFFFASFFAIAINSYTFTCYSRLPGIVSVEFNIKWLSEKKFSSLFCSGPLFCP